MWHTLRQLAELREATITVSNDRLGFQIKLIYGFLCVTPHRRNNKGRILSRVALAHRAIAIVNVQRNL